MTPKPPDTSELSLDIKHSKENLQTVIEEINSLIHRSPKHADGHTKSDIYFIYALMPEEANIYVQAGSWEKGKGGKWGFEIVGSAANAGSGLSEREEMEFNSLGWHYQTGSPNLYQEFSEGQLLRGDAAANVMDALRRYRTVTDPSMARVRIEAGVELIRLTEKDFEGGRIRRPEPSDDSVTAAKVDPFGWTLAISALLWFVVVSSGVFSVLPWSFIFLLGLFNMFILSWAAGGPAEDASRTPESSKRRRQAIPEKVRHSVWRRDEGRCVKCGSQEKLEYDHIIPWSKGGSDTERNIQLLCERCNRTKSASI